MSAAGCLVNKRHAHVVKISRTFVPFRTPVCSSCLFALSARGCTVCCVLDGHGPFGYDICNLVQQDLIRLTTSNPALSEQPRRILLNAFLTVSSKAFPTVLQGWLLLGGRPFGLRLGSF